MKRKSYSAVVPYTPADWTPQQAECHTAADLEAALYQATCLASGWYRRPVTIDGTIIDEGAACRELYRLRPSEVAPMDGWYPIYTVMAHNEDGTVRHD